MGIFRTTDPTQFDDVDGIIINESAPAPNVAGVAANIAILVGQAQRGPTELTEVGSIGEFMELYGVSSFGINNQLKNKKFGRLKIIRAVAAAAVKAKEEFASGATDIIRLTARYFGAYGLNIQVKIEAGSTTGKKYTIKDTNPDAVLPIETYDNVTVTNIVTKMASSKLITVEVLSSSAEPDNTVGFVGLLGGADGAIGDTDYETAIAKAAVEGSGNILFLDAYNSTRNGYLKVHAAETQDKMVLLCGPEVQSIADVKVDVANYRDVDGRIIYAFPWVETSINGQLVMTPPASWVASIISQTSPHIDPAAAKNSQFLAGVTALKLQMSRNDYIQLKEAGICAFENDSDIGYKLKSGIVTQIADSSKVTILRRRMTDFLTYSIAKYLKNFQNAVNSKENRTLVKGGIVNFDAILEKEGILPKDSEVKAGKAKLIDTESANTDSSIAAGVFKILYKRRIYSSMRFIVLQAEIGESVVVTEQA